MIKRSGEIQRSAAYKIFFKQKSGTFACQFIFSLRFEKSNRFSYQ
jgi:hypothetical protein